MTVETYGYAPILGPLSYPLFATIPLVLFAGAYNLMKAYKLSPWREERRRLILLIVGMIFPLIGLALDSYSNLPPMAIWGNLILSIICTTAILKYNLIEIRFVVRKSLVYVLVSAVVAIPYVGGLYLLFNIFGNGIIPWWLHIIALLLLAIVLRPLYGWAQHLVDRAFFRDRYDYLKALEQFSHQAQSILNLERLGSNMVKLISGAFRTSSACLLLMSEDSGGFVMVSCIGLENPLSGTVLSDQSLLVKWLKLHPDTLSSEDLAMIPQLRSLSLAEKTNLERMGAKLCVPIRNHQGQLSGILVLGQKLSQQPYSSEDRQLLVTVSSQMAMTLENAELYEERRKSEEALLESEEKLYLTIESMVDGITVCDLNGNIQQVNHAVVRMHCYDSKQELIGRSIFELVAERDKAKAVETLRRTLENGHSKKIELTFLKRDVGGFPVELSAAVLKDASGNYTGFVAVTEDITERKQGEEREKHLQQQLYLSSRLAAIGELAAGVAHEINNPLTGIIGFSQRLLRKSTDEKVRQDSERIHSEAQRAAKIVQNLLTFARRHESKKEYSNINDILQKTLELRAYELKTSNIEVVTDLAPSLPKTEADFQQIEEVFLNIVINAERAIIETKSEGKLTIQTQEVGDYIRVSFTDNGHGIPAEHLDQLFDPFFTTRGERGGTGLGLSICHGIVVDHGGRIYTRSEPGQGATFIVELPVITEEVEKSEIVEE